MPRFENKNFIVTGGASLIGLAIARAIIADGGRVILSDLKEEARAEAEDALGDKGTYLAGDVREDSYLDALIDAAISRFRGLDGFVNAAASFEDRTLEASREEWLRSLDINLASAAILTQKAVPHIKQRGGGAIVYVGSISAYRAQPGRMVYPVTKAAVVMLAKNASLLLAPDNIRVNTVSPGWTWSRNIDIRYGGRERADSLAAEFQALGRLADPEEIASAVAYLLSPEASFITGTDLAVDGGYNAMGPEALGQPMQKVPVL